MAGTLSLNDGKIDVHFPLQDKQEAYLVDPELAEAVNLAILLERPLLIKGEPGCGKTRLARAIAWSLYGEQFGEEYETYYYEWHVKSVTKAREGLYRFDYVQQLRDTQRAKDDPHYEVKKDFEYVRFGELGEAFQVGQGGAKKQEAEKDVRPVILIDEIDKADVDFPNDLLLELDQLRFVIEELPKGHPNREVIADHANRPIVIITSNDEKELPPAFLRRCVFYFIKFPHEKLEEIVRAHFPDVDEELRQKGLEKFRELRQKMEDQPQLRKKVSTSELIDWFRVIRNFEKEAVMERFATEELPYAPVLLKQLADYNMLS